MSDKERIIDIQIPQERQIESVEDLADFIENELKPPSRVKWIIIYFAVGMAGGLGLGVFMGWWWVK
jgi:fatty acid desaturase